METLVVQHPLVRARLTTLRDRSTTRSDFRAALRELSTALIYESLRDLAVRVLDVQTPLSSASGAKLAESPTIVPVLRAALGMLDAALVLLPDSQVAFVGLRRNEDTRQPEVYLQAATEQLRGRSALVLDPMVATGGSLEHACQVATAAGARSLTVVSILAAPEGVARIEASGMVARFVTAAIDSHLDEAAFIVPGLGDAGDRQFGPP